MNTHGDKEKLLDRYLIENRPIPPAPRKGELETILSLIEEKEITSSPSRLSLKYLIPLAAACAVALILLMTMDDGTHGPEYMESVTQNGGKIAETSQDIYELYQEELLNGVNGTVVEEWLALLEEPEEN